MAEAFSRINLFEGIVQRVSLAHLHMVKAFDDRSTQPGRQSGGMVGAVICNYIDIDQLSGICLFPDTFQKPADYGFLISGGYQDSKTVHLYFTGLFSLFFKRPVTM